MMTLILGGSGSGKSAYAEDYLLRAAGDKKKYYIATMQIRDAEMQAKVDRHHRLRQGKGFTTIEQPTELEQAVLQMEPAGAVLLECMSNLTANEMFSGEKPVDRQTVITKILQGMEGLRKQADPLVIVTNNVFEDGMIYDDSTMEYIEALGRINERLAAEADEVVEVVAGIFYVFQDSHATVSVEGRGHAVRPLLFSMGGCGDRCFVVSVEMVL